MRIAVFGAGAVGSYFGGRLAEAGEDVVLIARGKNLRALRGNGLRVDSIKGDFVIKSIEATNDPSKVGPVDVILIGVKAWQIPEAAAAIRPMVGPETFCVPLQNGVEAPSQLAAVLGREHVLGGLCGLVSFIVGPGHIRHTGIDPFIQFGELDNKPSERVKRLCQAFQPSVGVEASSPVDIQVAMWEKFLFIASWGGVGAVTRAPIGVSRSQPETRAMLERTMKEIAEVGRLRNVTLAAGVVTKTMQRVDGLPAHGTASMQRDIMEGRPSELCAQNGAVVRFGRESAIDTPINTFICHSLLPLERRARGQIDFEL